MKTINIDKYEIREEWPANQLSRIQKLVCRLFKITPKIEYAYTVIIWSDDVSGLGVNDVLLDEEYRRWFVLAVSSGGGISIRNMIPTNLKTMRGKLKVYNNCQPESSRKP